MRHMINGIRMSALPYDYEIECLNIEKSSTLVTSLFYNKES